MYIQIDTKKKILLNDLDDIRSFYKPQKNTNETNSKMIRGNLKVFKTITDQLTKIINTSPHSIILLHGNLPIIRINIINIHVIQSTLTKSHSAYGWFLQVRNSVLFQSTLNHTITCLAYHPKTSPKRSFF